jgi:hypothetical protein
MKRVINALKRVSWARWLGGAGILLLALLLAGYLVLSSEWFANNVRQRIITEVERTTGAQIEIGHLRLRAAHRTGRAADGAHQRVGPIIGRTVWPHC